VAQNSAVVFRVSRVRTGILAAACASGAWIGFQMIDPYSIGEALGMGRGLRRDAMFTIIMLICSALFFLLLFFRPRSVTIESSGISVRCFSGNFDLEWSDVLAIERGGTWGNSGVDIVTPSGRLLVAYTQNWENNPSVQRPGHPASES